MGGGGVWPMTWPVNGDFTSTLTGGALEREAPQLKQYLASSALGLPQDWHGIMV